MSGSFSESMIHLSFPFVVCHSSMLGEKDLQLQSLQIETCSCKLTFKTMIKQEGNFELALSMFVGHENLTFANSQATTFLITVGNYVRHP
jgi:hypothetical protein